MPKIEELEALAKEVRDHLYTTQDMARVRQMARNILDSTSMPCGKKYTVTEFAEKLSDAYSTDNYGGGWSACIRKLRAAKYDDAMIEAIIRSKFTRWAADHGGKRYGRASSNDLMKWLTDNGYTPNSDEIKSLVRETFHRE